jgi:hypothetical protein
MKTLHEQEIREHIAEKIKELSYMTLSSGEMIAKTHLPLEQVLEVVLTK